MQLFQPYLTRPSYYAIIYSRKLEVRCVGCPLICSFQTKLCKGQTLDSNVERTSHIYTCSKYGLVMNSIGRSTAFIGLK